MVCPFAISSRNGSSKMPACSSAGEASKMPAHRSLGTACAGSTPTTRTPRKDKSASSSQTPLHRTQAVPVQILRLQASQVLPPRERSFVRGGEREEPGTLEQARWQRLG